jgi:hypothetical protein
LNEIGLLVLEKISFSNFLICYNLPLEKGIALYSNNYKSPLAKDDLCHL